MFPARPVNRMKLTIHPTMMGRLLLTIVTWNVLYQVHSSPLWPWDAIAAERDAAAKSYREGDGSLWFYHNQKAAGTTICKALNELEKPGGWYKACYLGGKGKHSYCASNLWALGQVESLEPHHMCTHDFMMDGNYSGPKAMVLVKPDMFLNGTAHANDIVAQIRQIQHLKQVYNQKFVSSEEYFLPRSVLKSWLIHRDPHVVAAFAPWSFIFNIRHPVFRLYSAFHYHTLWFPECGGNFSYCVTTPAFTTGTHRNRLVKQLSGYFAPCEMGGNNAWHRTVPPYSLCQAIEATEADLSLAKLVVHRFLPPVVVTDAGDGIADRDNIFGDSMYHIGNALNIPLPRKYGHMNVGKHPSRANISCNDFKVAAELNSLDMQLYEHIIESLGLRNTSSISNCE